MTFVSSRPRIAVLGAGIIGLSAAYELAMRRGARVTLHDVRAPGRGASWAAAGMLAPAFEAAAEPGVHPQLFDLCLASAALWPAFAQDLSARAGEPVGFDRTPSLAAALDAREMARLSQIAGTLSSAGIDHLVLGADAICELEPAISRAVLGGLELPTDLRVHNRRTVSALLTVLRASANVDFVSGPALLKSEAGRVSLDGHDAMLAAAGWETSIIKVKERGELYSLTNWDAALDDIDCHGGQMLSVAATAGAPQRVVRSGHVYLVPRGGQVVIGATVEPDRVIEVPEAGVIEALRREGVRLCPGLANAPVAESWAGVRPGTPDQAPFIGETVTPGLFVAAGHYRNGILLAPVTAQIIADALLGAPQGELAATFTTRRAYGATA
ncbi:MAG: FAD-dependent oxidoreductase [Hyphomonas sp.]|uniref:FAD-dependent oxidoreductase n=1 Tax=Hyphomonas sp. TaxID=87 RepID=UPI0034A079DC